MKKWLFVLFFLCLFVPAVLSQAPAPSVNEVEYNALKGFIDNRTPIDNGRLNFTRWELNATGAETRILAINDWFDTYAYWLWLVFGMVPEVSWLFAINLWVWLVFFTALVLNGHINISESRGRLIGLGVFVVLLMVRLYLGMALALHHVLDLLITVIIPYGVIIAVILSIVLLVLAIYFWPVTVRLLSALTRLLSNKAKDKLKAKLAEKVIATHAKAIQKAA